MGKRFSCALILAFTLIAMLAVSVNVQKVRAPYPTIYIKTDGSIDPATANITSFDNVTYTFTADIRASIVVRKNNTVIDGAGYTVQGSGAKMGDIGIDVSYGIYNVIVKNVEVSNFSLGIRMDYTALNTITGNTITNNEEGIQLYVSGLNTITGNTITNNEEGISVLTSNNNTITGNTISNCGYGIILEYVTHPSINNIIFHNNLIDSANNVEITSAGPNVLDSGLEGNYWSNYTGADLNHDGIGDTPHVIDANNTDYYPLMGMFHSFTTSLGKSIKVISNSSVSGFTYESPGTIRFHVSNMTANQTQGFCRISIPYEVMSEPFNVTVDGATPTYWNYTLYDNGTHQWIYFEYTHSTREIVIIPESPSLLILSLFMTVSLLAALAYRGRRA